MNPQNNPGNGAIAKIPIGTIIGPLTEETKMPVLEIFQRAGIKWMAGDEATEYSPQKYIELKGKRIITYNETEPVGLISPETFLCLYSLPPAQQPEKSGNAFDGLDAEKEAEEFSKALDHPDIRKVAATWVREYIKCKQTPPFLLLTEDGVKVDDPDREVWSFSGVGYKMKFFTKTAKEVKELDYGQYYSSYEAAANSWVSSFRCEEERIEAINGLLEQVKELQEQIARKQLGLDS